MVSVSNTKNALPDPAEKRLDVQSSLVLEVGKLTFTQNAVAENSLTEITVTSSTSSNANLGALQYQTATSANIGDYMQLLLKDTSSTPNQIFLNYA